MTQVQTFDLGFNRTPRTAPTLPEPLDPDEFHTRQEIRNHQSAVAAYHEWQRQAQIKIRTDADNKRARELADAQREQTDDEYDIQKRKQWEDAKHRAAELLAKEKADAMEKTAYLLSSPAVAEIITRSEFTAIQSIIHWASRGYKLEESGFISFGNGHFNLQMTAPAKKVVTK